MTKNDAHATHFCLSHDHKQGESDSNDSFKNHAEDTDMLHSENSVTDSSIELVNSKAEKIDLTMSSFRKEKQMMTTKQNKKRKKT